MKDEEVQFEEIEASHTLLDGIPGVVPGLVPGFQGCKNPGSLGKTWDQANSLKFILIDSNFLLSPVLRPPVTLGVSLVFRRIFLFSKRSFSQRSSPWTDDGHGWVLGDPPSVIRNGWYGWSNPPIRHPFRMV